MKLYKGFDKDMKCSGFQFEEGKTYVEENAKLCESGFHACEYPLDCFRYYAPNDSEYHEVYLDDVSNEKESDDSKRVGKRITIGARLSIKNIVDASVGYINDHIDKTKKQSNTGNFSAATNTGNFSAATNTGYCSAATNTGNFSAATNTGDRSAATNTGYFSAATNTGDHSAATNTGDRSAATNTGYCSAATNTGDRSAATNTGYCSAAEVGGERSVAIAIGNKSKARGAKGCWIVVGEWTADDDGVSTLSDVQCVLVDGETVKADTWYTLKNGKFVEA